MIRGIEISKSIFYHSTERAEGQTNYRSFIKFRAEA